MPDRPFHNALTLKQKIIMINLKIIIASTRPGRKGIIVADWIIDICKSRKEFDVEVLDLAEINLPFLDEPKHPRFKDYTQDHTKKWSKTIDGADAFILVTPEYNHGYPATLKNALDFLYQEWNNKPVAFVSYGGVAGGTRSVQQLIQVINALQMKPIISSVVLPAFTKHINDQDKFVADDGLNKSVVVMLNDLAKWADQLSAVREKK